MSDIMSDIAMSMVSLVLIVAFAILFIILIGGFILAVVSIIVNIIYFTTGKLEKVQERLNDFVLYLLK